ncbi:hypothetical protein VNO77_11318 [Canavalia gladiata]|uniref:J domain-containing protein required for chloroplast accumulation response 1 n=1 Tax=Canavalia gladiata TaxID=3824 RepID=A0AAN9QY67_CANGL
MYNSERESILLGYNYNSLIRRPSSTNPSTPQRNSDVDFTDVFGGPPRWSSVTERRESLNGLEDWSGEDGETGEGEKPVFGEENGNRRRYPNKKKEFFDDIFGGEESPNVCSTPKKRDGEGLRSRVMSPAADPVASSALPLPFSLPAKMTNGVDLPTFGSPSRSRNPLNDSIIASNGLGSSDYHLSRFSSQPTQRKELKSDSKSSYQRSLLSQELSSDKADKGSNMNMKQDMSMSEDSASASNGQFHFSIYKWASKEVPLVMPLRTERTSRTKDKDKLERCSSAKEWMVSEITAQNPTAHNGSSLLNNRKQDVSTISTATQNEADSHQIVEQIVSAKALSDIPSRPQTVTKDVLGSSISCDARAVEPSTHSTSEIRFSGKTKAASKTQKLEPKPLHSLFKESEEKHDYDEMIRRENEENKTKSTKKLSAVFDVTANPRKQEEKTVFLRDVGHSKATSQGSLSLSENMGKGRVKGKVKEFVRIFNQEAVTKPRVDSKSRLQGSAYKQRDALRTKNDVEEGDPERSKKENSATEATNMFGNNLSHQDDISASAIPDISFAVIGDKDDSFHGNFVIEVLTQDEGEILQNQENQEIQVINNKIQRWSKGKEGNIRSLLSTLQHVLWPECGWKPVPLVDIIEGNAVKRAYQRALLCLHPDKLQQKGAAPHQKYIAEKVFDILQEAWTQFNMLGAL